MGTWRPLIGDKRLAVAAGLGLLAAAFVVLHDAYDGRGAKAPFPLSAVLPW